MHEIVITQHAKKDLKNLDKMVIQRIGNKLKFFSNDPLKYARGLTDPKIGGYRFRIGDYRVIFDIDDDKIIVLRVGHRKEIYK